MPQSHDPSVSVIIPVFNGAPFIERTILSVERQTHGNIDIIVVDDGSTDSTPAILDRLRARNADLRVITIPNGGVANARNVGTQASGADYVAYLDADDLWHPTKITKQVAALESHAGDDSWAACYTLFRTINSEDYVLGSGAAATANGAMFPSHLVDNHVGNGSSLLVRRTVALEVGGFDPSYARMGIGGCEDRDFQLRILQRYKMDLVREFLVGYRTYPGNMSSNDVAMSFGGIAVIRKFLQDARIPDEIRNLALSSAYGNSFVKLTIGGCAASAGKVLVTGLRQDPAGFASVVRDRSVPIVRRYTRRIKQLVGLEPKSTGRNRPPFHDLDPTDGLAQASESYHARGPILRGHDRAFEPVLSDWKPLPDSGT